MKICASCGEETRFYQLRRFRRGKKLMEIVECDECRSNRQWIKRILETRWVPVQGGGAGLKR
jgi:hypothetical protein